MLQFRGPITEHIVAKPIQSRTLWHAVGHTVLFLHFWLFLGPPKDLPLCRRAVPRLWSKHTEKTPWYSLQGGVPKEISGMCALSKKVPFLGKKCKYHSEGSFFRTIHNGLHTLFTDNLETEWQFFVFLCNKSHFIPSHDRTLRTDRLEKNPT